MNDLKTLQKQSINLYHDYRSNLISINQYLKEIKPIDKAIDQIEMENLFKMSLQNNSTKQLLNSQQ
jgi:hypothetical protein